MTTASGQIKELLREANQLNTRDLGDFVIKVREILSKRRYPAIPEKEAALLLQIQEVMPVQLLEKAALLHEKRRDGLLTALEQDELLRTNQIIEDLHIKRLELLSELSQTRAIPLKTLMQQLGIEPYPTNG